MASITTRGQSTMTTRVKRTLTTATSRHRTTALMPCRPTKSPSFTVTPTPPTVHDKVCLWELVTYIGALDMKLKTANDALTTLDDVFMLDVNDKMGEQTMDRVKSIFFFSFLFFSLLQVVNSC